MAPDETTKVASQLECSLRGHQKDALKHIQVIRSGTMICKAVTSDHMTFASNMEMTSLSLGEQLTMPFIRQ